MVENIIQELEKRVEVDAVLLGGSRATGAFDKDSDYDYYVYLNASLDESVRRTIMDPYVRYMEYSNHFWELEDDGVLISGVEIEFIYRDVSMMENMMENLFVKGNVSHGYTTCFLDNLVNSVIVFDKTGDLTRLQEKYKEGINDMLVKRIVEYNFPIVYDRIPALYKQLEKAVKRDDVHSINHRTTAYFELYYDILFAINYKTHPGEKRLLEYAKKLPLLPKDFVEIVPLLFESMYQDKEAFLLLLKRLSVNLKDVLEEKKYV